KAGIAHAAAVQVDRVIEERAIAIGCGLHPLKEFGKQLDVVGVDLGDLCYLHGVVAVMANRVMRVRNSNLGIGTIALLARELERDDTRDVGLKRQNLQVEHDLGVVRERRGNAYRSFEVRRLIVSHGFLASRDLTLHLAYALEI